MGVPDPIFFFSYSQADTNDYLDRFFEELRERLASLLGLGIKPTDPDREKKLNRVGFRDVYGVATGEDWKARLGAAIRHNGILVCLYSPNFFAREPGFCGKEFQAFLERHGNDVWYAPRTPADEKDFQLHGWRNIVPVLWEGFADLAAVGLPPYVLSTVKRDLQRGNVSADLNRRYVDVGMRVIAKRPKSDAFDQILGHFARQIRDMRENAPPPLDADLDLETLCNAFWDRPNEKKIRRDKPSEPVADLQIVPPAGGPKRMLVIVVRERGQDAKNWRPYKDENNNTEASVASVVEEFSNSEKVAIDWMMLDPRGGDFGVRVNDALRDAEKRSNRAILIVDPHCLADAAPLLKAVLGESRRAGVLIAADARDGPAGALIARHRAEFQPVSAAPNWVVRVSVGTVAQFRIALNSLAADMLARIVRTDDVPRKIPDNGGPAKRPRITNLLDEAA